MIHGVEKPFCFILSLKSNKSIPFRNSGTVHYNLGSPNCTKFRKELHQLRFTGEKWEEFVFTITTYIHTYSKIYRTTYRARMHVVPRLTWNPTDKDPVGNQRPILRCCHSSSSSSILNVRCGSGLLNFTVNAPVGNWCRSQWSAGISTTPNSVGLETVVIGIRAGIWKISVHFDFHLVFFSVNPCCWNLVQKR